MGKYKSKILIVAAIIVAAFVVGLFSCSITIGDFFFTTKYFKTPIDAYNDYATIHAIYGNTRAEKEIGLLLLDDETGLFIAKLYDDQVYNNRIVIDEMKIKNGRYVSKGISSLCDLNDEDRIENLPIETTKTMNGHVSCSVLYSREEAEKLPNVASINS